VDAKGKYMKKWTTLILLMMSTVSFSKTTPHNLAPMLKKTMPSVVNLISTSAFNPIKNPLVKRPLRSSANKKLSKNEVQILGSGVIINAKKGLIVTNAHVIKQAHTIIINLINGRRYQAMIQGIDKQTDLALLRIHAPHLTAISFGNSSSLQIGDTVVAIGSPFGLSQTVTAGIVSALHRTNLNIAPYEDFIQTDAPINQGNSGGALVNRQGQLVGINTAIIGDAVGDNIGIGFAIPSNMVKRVVSQLIKHGDIKHSSLGVIVQNLTPQQASALGETIKHGALVSQVLPASPAEKAGLKTGDIIIAANGQAIKSNTALRALTVGLRPKSRLTLTIIRHKKTKRLFATTTTARAITEQQKAKNPYLYGMQLHNVTGQTGVLQPYRGVKIVDIETNSLPWSMGLSKNDIILSANGHGTPNLQSLNRLSKQATSGLLLTILHNKKQHFVLLK
jgi:serine protease Do